MNTAVWDAIASNGSKSAVHCPTKELADKVVAIVKEMTGRGFIDDECSYWESYKTDTCYYPNVGIERTMQYSDIHWAKNNDMIIFEATDLFMDVELPIAASEVDIKSLFGME